MCRIPLIAAAIASLLAACQSCPIVPPRVVHVAVEKVVAVPAELSAPCDQPAKRDNSLGEAVRLANVRAAALDECNGRMARIRKLGEGMQP